MERPRRFGGRLAALSSAAILAVYAVGYTLTEDAAQSANSGTAPLQPISPASAAANATSTASATSRASTPGSTTTPTSTTTQRATVTATAKSAPAAYRDGTYVGYATGRHGSIEATVTVEGGKIAAVEISQCLTRYPCSRISSLPGQVVSRQTTQVDYVSGATDSSRTFMQAVANALASAG
jgi:uncharacterized protein with FMN-binding domain